MKKHRKTLSTLFYRTPINIVTLCKMASNANIMTLHFLHIRYSKNAICTWLTICFIFIIFFFIFHLYYLVFITKIIKWLRQKLTLHVSLHMLLCEYLRLHLFICMCTYAYTYLMHTCMSMPAFMCVLTCRSIHIYIC